MQMHMIHIAILQNKVDLQNRVLTYSISPNHTLQESLIATVSPLLLTVQSQHCRRPRVALGGHDYTTLNSSYYTNISDQSVNDEFGRNLL